MIEHPFVNDANEKTVEELLEIIATLYKKLSIANRMNNPALFNQLHMAINTYRATLQEKQRADSDKSTDSDSGFIDIQ
jgi:hypothetical protein